jgi:hypothetical protein
MGAPNDRLPSRMEGDSAGAAAACPASDCSRPARCSRTRERESGPGKAQTRPQILITDPERRKERGRRFLRYFVPSYVLIFAGIGYVLLGLGGAIFFFVIAVAGAWLGSWMFVKMQP